MAALAVPQLPSFLRNLLGQGRKGKPKDPIKQPAPAPPPSTVAPAGGGFMDHFGLSDIASQINTMGAVPASSTGTPADYMAAFNQLLSTMSGPAPSYSFDASPYQQAISQVQRQGELGQQVINQGGQDLMARLAQLRAQTEGRGVEDRAAIQNTQGKALASAQGSLSPVLADLAKQGVDVRAIEQNANQRIGTMGDQAALQNTLSQRLAQNTGQVLDATGRSAATQGAGALNQLAVNLSGAVNAIGQKQAAAGAQSQSQYLQDLAGYNKSRMGIGQDLLGTISKLGAGATDDVGMEPVRAKWSTQKGGTADVVNGLFAQIDDGTFESIDDIIGDLDGQTVPDPDDATKKITGWEALRRQGVNVNTVKAALREATKTPKPSTNPLNLLGIR